MKRFAIIGGIIFVVGIALFLSAFAMGGWDLSKVSTDSPYEKKELLVPSNNQTIHISDSNVPFTIGVSGDDKIHFYYYENEMEYYEVNNGSSIEFKKHSNYKWYNSIFRISFQSPEFTLLLPEKFNGDLNITTSNGSVDAGGVSFQNAEIITSNGKIKINNIKNAANVTAMASNGAMDISDTVFSGDFYGSTTNGSIRLNNMFAQNLEASTSNASINAYDVTSNENIILDTSNGHINADRLSAKKDIKLGSSNGGIYGTVTGRMENYSIISTTSNGRNNLPDGYRTGSQRLEVHTSNGNIEIDFIE